MDTQNLLKTFRFRFELICIEEGYYLKYNHSLAEDDARLAMSPSWTAYTVPVVSTAVGIVHWLYWAVLRLVSASITAIIVHWLFWAVLLASYDVWLES